MRHQATLGFSCPPSENRLLKSCSISGNTSCIIGSPALSTLGTRVTSLCLLDAHMTLVLEGTRLLCCSCKIVGTVYPRRLGRQGEAEFESLHHKAWISVPLRSLKMSCARFQVKRKKSARFHALSHPAFPPSCPVRGALQLWPHLTRRE